MRCDDVSPNKSYIFRWMRNNVVCIEKTLKLIVWLQQTIIFFLLLYIYYFIHFELFSLQKRKNSVIHFVLNIMCTWHKIISKDYKILFFYMDFQLVEIQSPFLNEFEWAMDEIKLRIICCNPLNLHY